MLYDGSLRGLKKLRDQLLYSGTASHHLDLQGAVSAFCAEELGAQRANR